MPGACRRQCSILPMPSLGRGGQPQAGGGASRDFAEWRHSPQIGHCVSQGFTSISRAMRILGSKRVLPHIGQPFVAPTSPDKSFERMMLALSIMSFVSLTALALYVALPLDTPQALWAVLGMMIMPLGLLWGWYDARRKRVAAEQKVERYRIGVQRALTDH